MNKPQFRWLCWQGSPKPDAISMGQNLWRRLQVNYGEGWCDIPCVWQTKAEEDAERKKQEQL